MTSSKLQQARIALVHDWLNQMGGAENVLEELVTLFPGVPLYTSIYAPQQMPAAYRTWPIHTSFMQQLPGITRYHQVYLPLYPLAFARTDLSGYDLVLSNKSGFCHGVYTGNGAGKGKGHRAIHVCYCLSPTRYLWRYQHYREREQISNGANAVLRPVLQLLRRWDWRAAQRVDHFIAISTEIQQRIRTVYGRESVIIYPPVDTTFFTPEPTIPIGDYYLIVGRLIPYKRIDLAIQAFNRLPQEKLLIVGEGRDRAALQSQANANITFLGRQSDAQVLALLRGCKAFLFTGIEDFGIAPVEAMSAGRPVIAYAGGGALDTVVEGVTGQFFREQSWECLLATLTAFDPGAYSPAVCRRQAEKFSTANFRRALLSYLEQVLDGAT